MSEIDHDLHDAIQLAELLLSEIKQLVYIDNGTCSQCHGEWHWHWQGRQSIKNFDTGDHHPGCVVLRIRSIEQRVRALTR